MHLSGHHIQWFLTCIANISTTASAAEDHLVSTNSDVIYYASSNTCSSVVSRCRRPELAVVKHPRVETWAVPTHVAA